MEKSLIWVLKIHTCDHTHMEELVVFQGICGLLLLLIPITSVWFHVTDTELEGLRLGANTIRQSAIVILWGN